MTGILWPENDSRRTGRCADEQTCEANGCPRVPVSWNVIKAHGALRMQVIKLELEEVIDHPNPQ